jgi:hypothetical protein
MSTRGASGEAHAVWARVSVCTDAPDCFIIVVDVAVAIRLAVVGAYFNLTVCACPAFLAMTFEVEALTVEGAVVVAANFITSKAGERWQTLTLVLTSCSKHTRPLEAHGIAQHFFAAGPAPAVDAVTTIRVGAVVRKRVVGIIAPAMARAPVRADRLCTQGSSVARVTPAFPVDAISMVAILVAGYVQAIAPSVRL